MPEELEFIVIGVVQGELTASVIKSHLESEGIPVQLKYDAAGKIYGLTVDGISQVKILVPRHLAEVAKHVIEPQEPSEDNGPADG
ncbi:MAG: DUF2007 domain-containing protein [Chloroflexota bacterium]